VGRRSGSSSRASALQPWSAMSMSEQAGDGMLALWGAVAAEAAAAAAAAAGQALSSHGQ